MAKKKNLKQKLKEAQKEVEAVKADVKTAATTSNSDHGMLFNRENYILMGAGLVLILIGFLLMTGGRHPDPNVFDKEALYSFRRITLAPILVLLGFAVEGYAILKSLARNKYGMVRSPNIGHRARTDRILACK